jgi:hypothetical protein
MALDTSNTTSGGGQTEGQLAATHANNQKMEAIQQAFADEDLSHKMAMMKLNRLLDSIKEMR